MADQNEWFGLGFTYDDVVMAWQHWRLAREFVGAFEKEGLNGSADVLEIAGEGNHLLYWYISRNAARVLDSRHIPWRRFLVDENAGMPPENARCPLAAP